jgi:hypothetical protein
MTKLKKIGHVIPKKMNSIAHKLANSCMERVDQKLSNKKQKRNNNSLK